MIPPPAEEPIQHMLERHLEEQRAFVCKHPEALVNCSLCETEHENGYRRPGGTCSSTRIDKELNPKPRPTNNRRRVRSFPNKGRRLPGEGRVGNEHDGVWEERRKYPIRLDSEDLR